MISHQNRLVQPSVSVGIIEAIQAEDKSQFKNVMT